MSGEREAFMSAILATPDDDTPRLVFADWLDEHGTTDEDRAHAPLIRAQCRLELLPSGKERSKPEREARARSLLRVRSQEQGVPERRVPPAVLLREPLVQLQLHRRRARRPLRAHGGVTPPLVSVVLPTRDRPRLLPLALEWYRRQTYANRELVVVDDGEDHPVAAEAVDLTMRPLT